MRENIFVFGAGGHAKVVLDVIERQGIYTILGLFDDKVSMKDTEFYGYAVLGGRKELLEARDSLGLSGCVIAVGDNQTRLEVAEWMTQHDFGLVSAIHCSSAVARGATIGPNTVVMAGTVINSDARIGASVIINTGATIDHDCLIGDGAHIAPGCHLCGHVTVGRGAFLGAGTTVSSGVAIGEFAVVGAGSVVVRDLPGHIVARGVPCEVNEN